MKNKINSFKKHVESIGLIQTLSYIFQRLFLQKEDLIKLKIEGLSGPIFLRNKSYDTHIFYQIFIEKEVDFDVNESPKLIMDCGANIGLSTLYFLKKYPNAKIFSIEPEKSNFNLLKKNTQIYQNVIQVNAAVWNENVRLNIIDEGEGYASFKVKEIQLNQINDEQVDAFTLSSLLEKYNIDHIDLLKIDIEGSEYELFNGNRFDWVKHVNHLAVEIHETIKSGVTNIIENAMSKNYTSSKYGEYTFFKKNN